MNPLAFPTCRIKVSHIGGASNREGSEQKFLLSETPA